MEKIENIQKEDIAAASITKEVPSESEYETETDDEVKNLTLVREFLGPSASAFSGKKSRFIAGDVKVET